MAANKASYTKIGFAVILGVVAIIGALVYLGGIRGKSNLVYAETYYEKSVSGLSVGSPVNFRGVKVGEVSEIGFVGGRYDVSGWTNHMVLVRMAFAPKDLGYREDFPVPFDTVFRRFIERMSLRATVTASGITGLSRIELDLQTNVAPFAISWQPKDALYIPPAVSLLDSFSDSATKVMNQINRMDLEKTWNAINESILSLAKTAEGAQALMETRRADIEKLTGDLSEAVSSVRELAEEVKANPSLLVRERIPERIPETTR